MGLLDKALSNHYLNQSSVVQMKVHATMILMQQLTGIAVNILTNVESVAVQEFLTSSVIVMEILLMPWVFVTEIVLKTLTRTEFVTTSKKQDVLILKHSITVPQQFLTTVVVLTTIIHV